MQALLRWCAAASVAFAAGLQQAVLFDKGDVQQCCAANITQLLADSPVDLAVASGAWKDFIFVSESEDDSLVFEVETETTNPTAVGVYLYDGRFVDDTTDLRHRCILCEDNVPTTNVAITSVASMHPSEGPPINSKALDMDTVSHIGNRTHRRFFVYVGECYHMVGSVYYLSIFGQSGSDVRFRMTAKRVPSQLKLASSKHVASSTGSVCDGKYMHYFVAWDAVHLVGGLQLSVTKTSGELDAFYVRYQTCAGASNANLAGPINLAGFGRTEGSVHIAPTRSTLGRYYVSVRGSVDLCGDFTVVAYNMSQHEWRQHASK